MRSRADRTGRSARSPWALGALTAALVAAVVVAALSFTSRGGTSYRTATVMRGSVAQTLTTTGELSPVRSSDVDFQVAGTVAGIRAVVGHKVVAGQTLAHLDRSSLRATLGAARSQLTSARQRLSEDEASEVSATTSTTSASSASAALDAAHPTVVTTTHPQPSGSPRPPSGSSPGPVTTATLTRDQNEVRAAQRATDAGLAAAKTALATETSACAAPVTSDPPATSPAKLSCTQAAQGLLHDQQTVNRDETAVDSAEQALSRDLATATKAFLRQQKAASSSGGSTHHTTSRTSSTGSSLVTVTAADIDTDQATIDQAAAEVATATASVAQATMTAPISGTVTAVTINKGDTVSGESSATKPAVEIVGSRQEKATVFLSDTQVRTLKVGLPATVLPDGASQPVNGRVVAISPAGTEAASGGVSYPVTINLAASVRSLVAGADAAVSITLAAASDVIAVPTSAVHYQGSTTYVDLLRAGKQSRRTVTVGTVGPALTEVRSGLAVGQRVVLANLKAAVPSSSTTLTGPTGFGGFGGPGAGGGFGGTGGFGGGRTFVAP